MRRKREAWLCVQDMTRTGTYYWAIMNNRQDFQGKVVVDVGAGTGILSLFAAQARPRLPPPLPLLSPLVRHVLSRSSCARHVRSPR